MSCVCAGRADRSILHSESVALITLLSQFAKFVTQSSLICYNEAPIVQLVSIMVPKASIKSFKFFQAVEVPKQGICHRICHFAPLVDFLQVSIDHSTLRKKNGIISQQYQLPWSLVSLYGNLKAAIKLRARMFAFICTLSIKKAHS